MRPEKHRTKSHRAGVAHARTILKAQLNWLCGFPLGQGEGWVEWMCAGAGREFHKVRLHRDDLRRAEFARQKLTCRFPHLLSHVVSDVPSWSAATDQLLGDLKSAVHRGRSFPKSRFDEDLSNGAIRFPRRVTRQAALLRRQYPALGVFLDAMSWLLVFRPQESATAIEWISARGGELSVLLSSLPREKGLVGAFTLWELARNEGEQRVDPLVRFLADPRCHTCVIDGAVSYLEQRRGHLKRIVSSKRRKKSQQQKKSGPPPAAPKPTFIADLIDFTQWALAAPRRSRRFALDLFGLMLDDELFDHWSRWWSDLHPLLRRARRLASATTGIETNQQVAELDEQLEALQEAAPAPAHLKHLLSNIQQAAGLEHQELRSAILDALRKLPCRVDQKFIRGAFLHDWLGHCRDDDSQLAKVLRAFRRYVSRNRCDSALLEPWNPLIDSWSDASPHSTWNLTDQLVGFGRDTVQVTFDALDACRHRGIERIESGDGVKLARLAGITKNAQFAAQSFHELLTVGVRNENIDEGTLECAWQLDGGKGRFGALAKLIHKAQQDHEEFCDHLITLAGVSQEPPWKAFLAECVLAGEIKALGELGGQARALASLKEPPPRLVWSPPLVSPNWVGRYPQALEPALLKLTAACPQAPQIAARILADNFPDQHAFQRELETIERLLAENVIPAKRSHLEIRRDNLQGRLASPGRVSNERLQRLERKLHHAALQKLLSRCRESFEERLTVKICQILDVDEAPGWLLEPRNLRTLIHVFDLEPAFRRWGIRIFRKRLQRSSWRPLEHPTNQAYLQKLRSKGVDPAPWLSPMSRTMRGKNDRAVRLSLEEDPLEIFHMGAHFNTCLSPGDCNYFSVIANIIDVNKRVLFARDPQNKVVGRCLLALTDDGALLTFEPYCHDPLLEFGELCAQFAEELAQRMKTVVAPRGEVSSLAAPDWYDDGPHDLARRRAFLKENSAFRRSLETIPLNKLPACLTDHFKPLGLNGLTLPLFLELKELDKRPQLVLPLLPLIENCPGLADGVWMRAAILAHRAGETVFTNRALHHRAARYFLQRHRAFAVLDADAMEVYIAAQPSAALRVLRQTRDSGVVEDEQEYCGRRRKLLAMAHQALGRTALASRLRG